MGLRHTEVPVPLLHAQGHVLGVSWAVTALTASGHNNTGKAGLDGWACE